MQQGLVEDIMPHIQSKHTDESISKERWMEKNNENYNSFQTLRIILRKKNMERRDLLTMK